MVHKKRVATVIIFVFGTLIGLAIEGHRDWDCQTDGD